MRLVGIVVLFVLALVVGFELVDPRGSARVSSTIAGVMLIVSGAMPSIARHRPRAARWLLLATMVGAGVVFGLLVRTFANIFR